MHPPAPAPGRLLPPVLRGGVACAALLLAALAWPGAASAQAARYELDPVHTRVMFELSHAGYSQAIGTVSGSTGTLVFDPEDWSVARVEVSVPLLRLDLGDAKWNRAALGRNLLGGDDHPAATFVSTRVEGIDDKHASVFGTLTLHGVSREVELDVVFNQLERYPLPPWARTVGFSARTTISRKAFGIDAWPTVIGDAVALRIEAEARRVGGGDVAEEVEAADAPAPAEPAPEDGMQGDAASDDAPYEEVPPEEPEPEDVPPENPAPDDTIPGYALATKQGPTPCTYCLPAQTVIPTGGMT